jgi:hypothetical protein
MAAPLSGSLTDLLIHRTPGWALLAHLALRGDAEMADSLIGTTVLAIVLGLLCAAVAGLLLSGDQDATEGAG